MDPVHRLNDAEIADGLEGKPISGSLAACEHCAEEYSSWRALGADLRQDVQARSEMPEYFWQRQQARIRERLEAQPIRLGWAAAVLTAIIVAACAMLQVNAPMRSAPPVQAHQTDADDLLMQGVQASLQQEVAGPLMPAAVLVNEVSQATKDPQLKEN